MVLLADMLVAQGKLQTANYREAGRMAGLHDEQINMIVGMNDTCNSLKPVVKKRRFFPSTIKYEAVNHYTFPMIADEIED
jgi:hypothetical protein